MKRLLLAACAMGLLAFGTARTALADSEMELVSGSDVMYWNGSALVCSPGPCSDFGATASSLTVAGTTQVSIQATDFNGWILNTATGDSYSPSCSATNVCISQNDINTIASGNASLQAYFGATGFTPSGALLLTESSTDLSGTATATGYAYTGPLGLSTSAPSLSGAFSGGSLSLTGNGVVASGAGPSATATPSSPYDITAAFNLTPGQGSYNVTETISSVPEPTSAILFGGVLLFSATAIRKRLRKTS
jgi:hypothetical protein